jgi:hypothetical protein
METRYACAATAVFDTGPIMQARVIRSFNASSIFVSVIVHNANPTNPSKPHTIILEVVRESSVLSLLLP